jgi:hypothetical protein
MQEFGTPKNLVSLVELTSENTVSCVKTQMEIGSFFQVRQGLNQGDGTARQSGIRVCYQKIATASVV